jgi:hypothetical protein
MSGEGVIAPGKCIFGSLLDLMPDSLALLSCALAVPPMMP